LDLSLSALHNIVNAGTISSAGNLNLTAGGSIINASSTGAIPLIQAMNNINLSTGNLVNSGTIASSFGNINITSQMVQNIAINNVGGVLQALQGAINVRDSAFTGAANLSMTGGDFLARELNLYSGQGDVTVDVERVEGTVNIYANEAHVTSASDSLALGTIKLDGDPTFINSTGDITITGLVSFAEKIAIIANGNITASGP